MGLRVNVVSRDRLKPHLGSVAQRAAVPPTRGRPRMASVALVAHFLRQKSQGGLCSVTRIETRVIVINLQACMYSNPRAVIVENAPNIFSRNISVYSQLSQVVDL